MRGAIRRDDFIGRVEQGRGPLPGHDVATKKSPFQVRSRFGKGIAGWMFITSQNLRRVVALCFTGG